MVYGPVLRVALSEDQTDGELLPCLPPDPWSAGRRCAVLRPVRQALRSYRPPEAHARRLRARCPDVFPAVRFADALHEPRPRSVLAAISGYHYRRRLDLQAARFRHRIHQVLQLRPRTGSGYQAWRVIPDDQHPEFGRQRGLEARLD